MNRIKLQLTIFILSLFPGYLIAQDKPLLFNEELSIFIDKHPAEKVYLHTDRDIYSVNDTIWFRIYVLDAQNNVPQAGFQSVYVELIEESKSIPVRNLILTFNGFGKGDFDLSAYKLKGGKYQLRAYSHYQRNFGNDFLFSKNILLTELIKDQPAPAETAKQEEKKIKGATAMKPKAENPGSVDLQFLPEGGHLSYGCPCRLAFITRDIYNRPVGVSGWIVNGLGEKIIPFSSGHDGMGVVVFIPEKDMDYKAVPDNYSGDPIQLPASIGKVQLTVRQLKDSVVVVVLWKHEIPVTRENYYLISSSGGKISFFIQVSMVAAQKQIKLDTDKFEWGINKLTIADSLMRPVAERLIFVKKDKLLTVTAKTDREEYNRREKVNVEVKTSFGKASIPANLSVSVVNTAQVVSLEEYPQNMLSYLLLNSELQGTIQNPSFYFKDDSIATSRKLDLVMLTHGWRNYNWNKFNDRLPDTIFKKEAGLEVSGKIKRLLGQKGVEDGKVTIFMKTKSGGFYFNETQTDSAGIFRFPPSIFPDSVSVFLQGVNKHNRKNIEVVNLASFQAAAPVSYKSLSFAVPGEEKQSAFNEMAKVRLAEDKAYNPGKYEILLDEVQVVKKIDPWNQNTDDGHSRIYGIADNVLVVDDKVFASDIWNLMSGRLPGVLVSGNSVTVRGNTPIFLLDGHQVDKELMDNIPVSDIDKIEVLKSASNLAVFGVQGANGVIAVYTKRGEIVYREQYYKGILSDKLRGYYPIREFYSPNYESNPTEKSDHRATLYWNPEVVSDSTGTAGFSFFTSDDAGPLLLKIEGISPDGKPGVGFITIPTSN